MDIKIFSKKMRVLLPQCIRGFSRYECNYLSRGKITLPQLWVLEFLSQKDGCLMSELAGFLGVSRPAVTGLIDRLIIQGLVKRENILQDRRAVKVKITTKGRRIVSNIWEEKRRTLVKVFSKIPAHDRKEHISILERVVSILAQESISKG